MANESNHGTEPVGRSRDAEWAGCVQRVARGDQQALSELYDGTSAIIYTIALRVLGNEADAEEITLDVYTQVWKTASKFSAERGSVTAWLSMLARSRAIDRFRARVRSRGEDPIDAVGELPSLSESPEAIAAGAQQSKRIRSVLAMIPADQRRAIELAYFTGLTQSELAAYLGEPLGTIKTRIRLGMIRIKEELERSSGATA